MPYWNTYDDSNDYHDMPSPNTPVSNVSTANRANVVELDEKSYQEQFVRQAIAYVDDEKTQRVSFPLFETNPAFHDTLHIPFLFQDLSDFDIDWYIEARTYTANLSSDKVYTARRYTRNGDEIVNAFMRNPDTFDSNPRVLELFKQMDDENRPFFWVQFLRTYMDEHDSFGDYITQRGELSAMPEVYRAMEAYEQATTTM
jgi:hypothetical protein